MTHAVIVMLAVFGVHAHLLYLNQGAENSGFLAQASQDRVQATPTILVGKSSGSLKRVTLSSASDATSGANAVETALG